MGTRADFYIGRGEKAEWLGSIAWDGDPSGITPNSPDKERVFGDTWTHKSIQWPKGEHIFDSTTEGAFRARLARFFMYREDVTLPENGWPWPWEDSRTTDYAYALDGEKVWTSCFGSEWFDPTLPPEEDADDADRPKTAVFPTMDKTNFARPGSNRSGVMVFTVPGNAAIAATPEPDGIGLRLPSAAPQ